jgi:hypothetical protein
MQLACPSCDKTLEFSGERPRFCSFCGQSLNVTEAPTITPEPNRATPHAAPRPDEAETIGVTPVTASLSIPDTIGGYRLSRRLGGGGMGAVYEAEEITSGRRVAVKLVLPEYAGSADTLVRFRQEGRLASALVHPRCVFVFAADEEAGRPYIVMELMPGETLDDLVRERGPLSVEDALAKILDVIDGLEEAHKHGLVHRDVKPSNCFLEKSGRVKVGDFGLARSLVADTKLTRTGAFIGTPLFAAPEQIHKNEPTDAQSDVYSVAATLYFLLTGRAPFQSGADAMATLARIVTENPPSMRTVLRDLPKALDKIVLRGLERDRRRRWKDLNAFRRALAPFLPVRPTAVGLSLRFGAFLIDYLVIGLLSSTVGALSFYLAIRWGMVSPPYGVRASVLYGAPVGFVIFMAYFTLLEGLLGWSVGKWLLRVRVGTVTVGRPPGVGRALVRTLAFYLLFYAGSLFANVLLYMADVPTNVGRRSQIDTDVLTAATVSQVAWFIVAPLLIASTMRARNGYRGLHEFLSGTRTYQLSWPRPRRPVLERREFKLEVTYPIGVPERVGGFEVRGALRWLDHERTLLAEDPRLGRTVWIWLRPASQPPLDAARRDIDRATRIRWIACGTYQEWQWDAFLAPTGMPLPVLAAGPSGLSWGDARPMLELLSEELDTSCAEGTLPASLTTHQVWVQPDGRVVLLGTPLTGSASDVSSVTANGEAVLGNEQDRALLCLRDVAVTALEGGTRPTFTMGDRVRAPVPVHAENILGRLLGGDPQPYAQVEQVRRDLDATRDRPTEVSRMRRLGHLVMTCVLLTLPLGGPIFVAIFCLVVVRARHMQEVENEAMVAAVLIVVNCGSWIAWAFATRGGYAYARGGIVLRRRDGGKPSRLQCGLRAFLVWGPIALLLGAAIAVAYGVGVVAPQYWRELHGIPEQGIVIYQRQPTLDWLREIGPPIALSLWTAGVVLMLLNLVLAIVFPRRSLHDWVAGTYLMPE